MTESLASGAGNGTEDHASLATTEGDHRDFVTMVIDEQWFGIHVLSVQDILGPQKITRVPLASKEISGALNLRGRIVTAIDMRLRLGLPSRSKDESEMSVVVEEKGELYSLLVDNVGEVLSLPSSSFESNPTTLDPALRALSQGIYPLEDKLLVVLDVPKLLAFGRSQAA
jgi:purine-binding chemotaxis protein CheW